MNKVKRISAIIGIIAILSLYLVTLLLAIFASDKAPGLFMASAFCTVIIPIMIHLFLAVYERVYKKQDIKDYNFNDPEDTDNSENE
ncbi:hypothetical protein DFR55_11935 [Herbinix hemicellulosilytica]|uniref:Uncharacterized protein n=1 Tax=Herbinix hemicellulosilytica TaxID=1564487 RepID=A0A0H5SSX1_HERHM|nr:hypothetical protein [Herbinix hemicellulosilytica]RBP57765.1 hypothetical protein DFR55_11935 [Herbinix hemicellulosilytica]CRZ33403.1 hypothetical protein HHT355_0189 [Herbinix hemicellulosilytica]